MPIEKDITTARRLTAVRRLDSTALDVTAATAAGTTAFGSTAAYSVGAVETTNEAAVAANSAYMAQGTGRRVSCCLPREDERAAGNRGQTSRRQAGAGANLPADKSRSVVMDILVARGAGCSGARSA